MLAPRLQGRAKHVKASTVLLPHLGQGGRRWFHEGACRIALWSRLPSCCRSFLSLHLPLDSQTPGVPFPPGSCPAAILMASPSPPQGPLLLCVEARPPQVHKTSLSFPLLALTREGGTTCLLRLPSAPSARSPLGPGPVSLFSPPAGPLLPPDVSTPLRVRLLSAQELPTSCLQASLQSGLQSCLPKHTPRARWYFLPPPRCSEQESGILVDVTHKAVDGQKSWRNTGFLYWRNPSDFSLPMCLIVGSLLLTRLTVFFFFPSFILEAYCDTGVWQNVLLKIVAYRISSKPPSQGLEMPSGLAPAHLSDLTHHRHCTHFILRSSLLCYLWPPECAAFFHALAPALCP